MVVRYKRHRWDELQIEFIEGGFNTLKEFAKVKDLNYGSSQFFVHTKGWLKIKEIISMNPLLFDIYKPGFNNMLQEMPYYFYTCSSDKWENAALTYIEDTRHNPCTLEQIALWYGLSIDKVKNQAVTEEWNKYRKIEKKSKLGVFEYYESKTEYK